MPDDERDNRVGGIHIGERDVEIDDILPGQNAAAIGPGIGPPIVHVDVVSRLRQGRFPHRELDVSIEFQQVDHGADEPGMDSAQIGNSRPVGGGERKTLPELQARRRKRDALIVDPQVRPSIFFEKSAGRVLPHFSGRPGFVARHTVLPLVRGGHAVQELFAFPVPPDQPRGVGLSRTDRGDDDRHSKICQSRQSDHCSVRRSCGTRQTDG